MEIRPVEITFKNSKYLMTNNTTFTTPMDKNSTTNNSEFQKKEKNENKNKTLAIAVGGVLVSAIAIPLAIKYFRGKNITKQISNTEKVTDSIENTLNPINTPTPKTIKKTLFQNMLNEKSKELQLDKFPELENEYLRYLTPEQEKFLTDEGFNLFFENFNKISEIIKDTQKSYLITRNLNKQNKDCLNLLIENANTLNMKNATDFAFYLRAINNENKTNVINTTIPLLKDNRIHSSAEISEVIKLTNNDIEKINEYIKITNEYRQANLFTTREDKKGFARIASPRETILDIYNKIITPIENKYYLTENIIPDGFIFFGEPCSGKTTLAKAISEHTKILYKTSQAFIKPDKILDEIDDFLSQATNLKPTKHAIFFIDNAERIFCNKNFPLDELADLIRNSSQKNNCSFLFAIDNPNIIPKELKNMNIVNIEVKPAEYSTYKDILLKQDYNNEDSNEIILEALNKLDFEYPNTQYSSSQIAHIVNSSESKQEIINKFQNTKPLSVDINS